MAKLLKFSVLTMNFAKIFDAQFRIFPHNKRTAQQKKIIISRRKHQKTHRKRLSQHDDFVSYGIGNQLDNVVYAQFGEDVLLVIVNGFW